MKSFSSFLAFIVVVLGVIFIQYKFFPRVERIESIHIDTIFYKHDSLIPVIKPVPYIVTLPPDTVEIPADTVELVKRYLSLHKEFYTVNEYRDTFSIDTIGDIRLYQKITQNKLDSMTIGYNLVTPKIIYTQTIANSKNSLYLGSFIGRGNFSPSVMYSRNNKYNYFLGYNIVTGGITGGILINMDEIKKLW